MVSVEFWPVDDTPPAIILSNRAITLTHLTFAGRKYRQFCRKSELVFPRPGSVAPIHRAEMAERRVKILRPGLENPEAGLEKPKPGLGTAKVWAEKKEGSFGYGSLPFAIANLSIGMRNSKFAFPELTF